MMPVMTAFDMTCGADLRVLNGAFDSWPSPEAGGRLFFEFEGIRTERVLVKLRQRRPRAVAAGLARPRYASRCVDGVRVSWDASSGAAAAAEGPGRRRGVVRRPPRRRGDVSTTAWRWRQPARPRHRRERTS